MKSLNTVQKAFLAFIVANIIWGAAAPIFKLALQNIPPFSLAFWRFFLGSLILLAMLRKKAYISLKSKTDTTILVWYALLGITINILFFFWGLQRTYAINSPVISSSAPILTMLFALLFLHERFVLRKFLGMVLGTIGILTIILEPLLEKGVDGSITGNVFLVIATVAAVGQTITGKKIVEKYDPVALTFWSFVIGSASFLPLAIYDVVKTPLLYQMLDWRGVFGIAYGAIFSSTVGYTLFAWALARVSATDSSMFTYIDPVAGTILSYFLLHEPITAPFLAGSVFIFGGILVAEGRLHYHPIHRLILLGKPVKTEIPSVSLAKPAKPPDKREVLASLFQK